MDNPITWVPFVLVGACWLYALVALVTGRMRAGRSLNSRLIDRRDEPARFWISWLMLVAMLCVFSYMLARHLPAAAPSIDPVAFSNP